MQDLFNFGMDMVFSLCGGYWFASFFQRLTNRRGIFCANQKRAAVALTVQYMVVKMLFWWLSPLKQLFYGPGENMMDMRQSIPTHAIYIAVSFVCVCLIYRESLQQLFYLVITFYALEEMSAFVLYAMSDSVMLIILGGMNGALERQSIMPETYLAVMKAVAFFWSLFMHISKLLLLSLACRSYGTTLRNKATMPAGQELRFLMIPPTIGLGFGILLRGTVYKIEGTQVFSLLEANPELRLVLPMAGGLCIVLILKSLAVLRALEDAYEERISLQAYRQQAEDMEEHIKDMESLYDGIRGVKHDLKNYAMDLEQLLQNCDVRQTQTKEEIQEYLDGLYYSMEQLDMRYATGNAVTDVVINRHFREAQRKGIETVCDFLYPKDMGIQAFDMAVILNNALENAREACEKESGPMRFIRIGSERRGNFLLLQVENGFTGKVNMTLQDGRESSQPRLPASSKQNAQQHGIGMQNISKCAQKYEGTMHWEVRQNSFLLTVMLQKNV